MCLFLWLFFGLFLLLVVFVFARTVVVIVIAHFDAFVVDVGVITVVAAIMAVMCCPSSDCVCVCFSSSPFC